MDKWLVVIVLLDGLCFTKALDCYNCTRVYNVSDCHTVIECHNSEYCLIERHGTGGNQTFRLGCADSNMCGITKPTVATTLPVPSRTTTHNTTLLPPTTHIHMTTTEPPPNNITDDNSTATDVITTITSPLSLQPQPVPIGKRDIFYNDGPGSNKVCCNTDSCNKHALEHVPQPIPTLPETTCHDKPGFDCNLANEYFNVCNDTKKAKYLCKKTCDLCDLVDGMWSEWGNWSNCDVTCGNGTRQRIRECDNPPPANGGDNCTGLDTHTESCTEQSCPIDGDWAAWTTWSECSVTCGIGLQNRIRNCSNPYPDAAGLFCLGAARDDKICIKRRCNEDTWLEWSDWSKCSRTCDVGLKTRTRYCNGTSLFGHSCEGDAHDTELCKDSDCSLSKTDIGEWLTWSSWSECSRTCGTGLKSRSRDCNGTSNSCDGDLHQSVLCEEKECLDPVSAFLVNGAVRNGPENGTIVLSNVLTNVGGDYNKSTGQFTCRIPGIYSFFISIEKQLDVNQAYCHLMENGNATVYVGSRSAFIHDNTYQQASNSAVLQLDIDDVIYLGMCSDPKTFTTKSTFSGHLLNAL